LRVVVIAVFTVCLSCFGLSLDCGQRLLALGGLCRRWAWSPEWLCVILLSLHEICHKNY